MSLLKTAEITALTGTVAVLKDTSIYDRIVAEIKRNNEAMPGATNTEKRAKVLADFEIIFKDIFDELVIPVGEQVIKKLFEALLEMAVVAIEAEIAA
ncbi:MAG: hypothetical protein ACXWAT_00975 [Methylobacter sp.]